jgi:hypothetical protein
MKTPRRAPVIRSVSWRYGFGEVGRRTAFLGRELELPEGAEGDEENGYVG